MIPTRDKNHEVSLSRWTVSGFCGKVLNKNSEPGELQKICYYNYLVTCSLGYHKKEQIYRYIRSELLDYWRVNSNLLTDIGLAT